MSPVRDLAIVGAGPAGLAAAATAVGLGLDTVLLDEQPGPGGQIYRAIDHSPLADPDRLGPDYRHGRTLVEALPDTDYRPETTVWTVETAVPGPGFEIGTLYRGRVDFLQARRLLLASGAQERPVPVPGWTLPGVMGAGAGQILLKAAATVPSGRTVLTGSGPLLYLLAVQYIDAGVPPVALLDTTPRAHYLAALPRLPMALAAPGLLLKGLALLRRIRRASVPHIGGVSGLRALGADRLEAVEYRRGGRTENLAADLLLLHQGVVPGVQITRALHCEHDWDPDQRCWRPRLDAWGNSSRDGLMVAGDGGGIGGARAAEHLGRLAALEAACRLGRIDPDRRDREAGPEHRALRRQLRVRPFLDRLYRPADAFCNPPDETVICRCEEITAGELRRVVDLGCPGPNQAKSFSRCGMGPCQGR
ncbi:MAG: (2Fe-2S)-binding protein, partial [Candidatus Competibacterales bacterium]|nr:(2Fe-2S)-binding protein [Candidatus Competibacterales bacterium]